MMKNRKSGDGSKKTTGEKTNNNNNNKERCTHVPVLFRVGPGPAVPSPVGELHVHRPATDPTKAANSSNRPSPTRIHSEKNI